MQIGNRLSAKRYIEHVYNSLQIEASPASIYSREDDFFPKQCNTIFNEMDGAVCIVYAYVEDRVIHCV